MFATRALGSLNKALIIAAPIALIGGMLYTGFKYSLTAPVITTLPVYVTDLPVVTDLPLVTVKDKETPTTEEICPPDHSIVVCIVFKVLRNIYVI